MTTIYLVRHGRTLFNLLNKVQGISDTPLLKEGERKAEELGERFKQEGITFDAAYSSDLSRAVKTAHLLLSHSANTDLPVIETADLRETSFGMFEGEPNDDVWARAGEESGNPELNGGAPDEIRIEGLSALKRLDTTGYGESYEDVRYRLEHILDRLASSGKTSILAVSHGMFINCAVYTLAKQRKHLPPIPNTSVTKLIYKDGRFEIAYVGRTEDL